MINKKLEMFEQEYGEEISKLKSLRFEHVIVPKFQIPVLFGYPKFYYAKAMSIAFAIPALAIAFGFFFYADQNAVVNKDLAQIEASNNRIMNQINTLDNSNNI